MKALTFLLLVAALVVPVSGAVITFDDINPSSGLPWGVDYAGFNWYGFTHMHRQNLGDLEGPGYEKGTVSGDAAAWSSTDATISSKNYAFDFNGVYLTSAWDYVFDVKVKG